MALIALRRSFPPPSSFRGSGALAAAARNHQPANPGPAVPLDSRHLWLCSLLQRGPSRVGFHHALCKKFHSENGKDLQSAGERVLSPVRNWDALKRDLKKENEKAFCRRLNSCASSEELLGVVSTLETLPDTLAATALQRICEVEKRPSDQRLPKEILEHSAFQALCFRFERAPSDLSNAALVTGLRALILLRVDPQSRLIINLVAECHNRLRRGGLESHSLCILGESLIRLQGAACMMLELILCQLQGEKLETFTPEDTVAIYRILQACPEKADQHQTFLNAINNFAPSIVSHLSPKSISQILTALVVLDQTQAMPLVIKLGKSVVRYIPYFTNEELRKVLEAFIYFGHYDRFFMRALEQHIASLCLTLDPAVTSTVTEYCSKKLILSKPILNAVAESFVCQSEKFSPTQIAELIEPFGKLNYLPPNATALFTKLENVLSTQFSSFPPKTLLRLLHSCSLIECHPVNFMARLFSPIFLQQLQGGQLYLDRLSLARLTQLFMTSVLECPFYKGPKLLPRYQVKSFLTPCCSLETPMDFPLYKSVVMGLIDLLGSRLYFASKVLTPYCYTIDVEIKLDEEGFALPFTADEEVHKRVALCIDGPKRFCSDSKHLLGKEAIKQRHLQLLGYQVVQIPCHDMEMLKSRLQVVEYLQRKIFAQNSAIKW
ncbi:FAST kinase domain-containing protein 3, mitochondrial [Dipodomys spectabilis]|uniref:FAST kinase domain-containing protein 3, mitochondrial n=1 Tax=Dipodomys spectabilis TaxID=105255 RepID=UPI001C541F8B|nr:FAST kinase domain-containing protein 3, mitochondrial [Dipodomys spectabilis]